METFKNILARWDVRFGCVVCATAGFTALGIYFDLNRSEWASWVQAIGSIAALAVALYIMSRQNKNAIRLVLDSDMRALRRRGQCVAAIVHNAAIDAAILADSFEEVCRRDVDEEIRALHRISSTKITEAKVALLAVPAHDLGSHKMTSALHTSISCLSDIEMILAQNVELAAVRANRDSTIKMLHGQARRTKTALEAFHIGLQSIE